jgi:two-component system, OmpR family, KDP operon response regulator KdpE
VTRVLVVDDEAPIRRTLAANLRARGYDVDLAETGEQALGLAARHHPDVVLLDLGLPGMDGRDVIDGLRGWTTVPIVVLSARGSERDKVAALDRGADDYVAKPFGMDELLARLRASCGGPSRPMTRPPSPHRGPRRQVSRRRRRSDDPDDADGVEPPRGARAPRREAGPATASCSRRCGGPGYGDESGNLRVHLAHLRAKLEPDCSHPRYLLTEPGMGYRFVP